LHNYGNCSRVKDRRASNTQHSLSDILMSGYAMLALKHPSLLGFEHPNQVERQNLKGVYGIDTFCSDARTHGMDYIINIKPDSHKTLFQQVKSRRKRGFLRSFQRKEGGMTHHFKYTNNLRLARSGEVRVNFLRYTQTDKRGKQTVFTWVSNLKISKSNTFALMKAARARWNSVGCRIENETFNTLKNLGYHFEHNFGCHELC